MFGGYTGSAIDPFAGQRLAQTQQIDLMDRSAYQQLQNKAALLNLLGLNAGVGRDQRGFKLETSGTLADTPIFQQLLGKSGAGGGGSSSGGYPGGGDLFAEQVAGLNKIGQSAENRIRRDASDSVGTAMARLQDRLGLGNNLSSLTQSAIDESVQQSLLGVDEQRYNALSNVYGSELDRRNQRQMQLQGQGMNLVSSLLGMIR